EETVIWLLDFFQINSGFLPHFQFNN
ncbi:hypothetical protein ACQUIS_10915, partial [Staphylococcus aureus]